MKKIIVAGLILTLCSCAQDPYHLKIDNKMSFAHGQSIYFRSNLRSSYASQIRNVLSKKFAQSGMKTATSAADADYIAIFDIETFYKQDSTYKNTTYTNTIDDSTLFTAEEDGVSLAYSGNANMSVDHDKTCFTLNIGRKETSNALYNSSFCAESVFETEDILPQILDIYSKYANYESVNVGVQCVTDVKGKISCDTVHDRQQAFINSLWIDKEIHED